MKTYTIVGAKHRTKDTPADFHTRETRQLDKPVIDDRGRERTTEVVREVVKNAKTKSRLDALHQSHLAAMQARFQKEGEAAPEVSLIAESVTIDDNNKARGILNCRVNGQHVQHRFNEALDE